MKKIITVLFFAAFAFQGIALAALTAEEEAFLKPKLAKEMKLAELNKKIVERDAALKLANEDHAQAVKDIDSATLPAIETLKAELEALKG